MSSASKNTVPNTTIPTAGNGGGNKIAFPALNLMILQGHIVHLPRQVDILGAEVKKYQNDKLKGDLFLGFVAIALVIFFAFVYKN